MVIANFYATIRNAIVTTSLLACSRTSKRASKHARHEKARQPPSRAFSFFHAERTQRLEQRLIGNNPRNLVLPPQPSARFHPRLEGSTLHDRELRRVHTKPA